MFQGKMIRKLRIEMKQRNFYFDLLRIISCFMVVMVHVSGIYFESYPVNTMDWMISNIYNCIAISGVPIFFMISGALMLKPTKKIKLKKFLLHHVLYLVASYFLTIFAYNLLYYGVSESNKNFVSFKDKVILTSMCGAGTGVGHLWFLPVLISIYLLVPIVKEGLVEEKNCIYFCIIFFAVAIVWKSMLLFPIPYYRIFESLEKVIPFELYSTYAGYFVLGHYLHTFIIPQIRKQIKISRNKVLCILFCILVTGLVTTICANACFSLKNKTAVTTANTPFFVGHFLSSTAFFTGIGILFYDKTTESRCIAKLSQLTFYIYLTHPAFIYIIQNNFGYSLNWRYPGASIFIATGFIFFLSLLLSMLVDFLLSQKLSFLHN